MSAVTAWKGIIMAEHERRYVASGAIAARITHIAGRTVGSELRPWGALVFRDGAEGPIAWWYYATLDEAMAGADDELSAIVGERLER